MLVALAITLIMMGAVVTLFGVISESVASSRSAIEMADRLRAARNTIQSDLQGATATMSPPLRPENAEGYLEIIEGQYYDANTGIAQTIFGDTDDYLLLTTRGSVPFRGMSKNTSGNTITVESNVAEVCYYLVQDGPLVDATQTPPIRLFTLYRRVLLVMPSLGPITPTTYPNNQPSRDWLLYNDISVRYDEPNGTQTLYPNSLGDLTKRENRFSHYNDAATYINFTFPFQAVRVPVNLMNTPPTLLTPTSWPANRPLLYAFLGPAFDSNSRPTIAPDVNASGFRVRPGDHVLLTNVLAFDVQVWDPNCADLCGNHDRDAFGTVRPTMGDSSRLLVRWNTCVSIQPAAGGSSREPAECLRSVC